MDVQIIAKVTHTHLFFFSFSAKDFPDKAGLSTRSILTETNVALHATEGRPYGIAK